VTDLADDRIEVIIAIQVAECGPATSFVGIPRTKTIKGTCTKLAGGTALSTTLVQPDLLLVTSAPGQPEDIQITIPIQITQAGINSEVFCKAIKGG
jgi:hypothetical protein